MSDFNSFFLFWREAIGQFLIFIHNTQFNSGNQVDKSPYFVTNIYFKSMHFSDFLVTNNMITICMPEPSEATPFEILKIWNVKIIHLSHVWTQAQTWWQFTELSFYLTLLSLFIIIHHYYKSLLIYQYWSLLWRKSLSIVTIDT